MKLVFSDGSEVNIEVNPVEIWPALERCYKHLQHVDVPFCDWDNPFYVKSKTLEQQVEQLKLHASKIGVDIDSDRCLNLDAHYFNLLHKIYEKNYDGNPLWLSYHEHIHMCEDFCRSTPYNLAVDWRELSGPLERPFDPSWLQQGKTDIKAGMVYCEWAELGKRAYDYWASNEPGDIKRICELVKPWNKLRPKFKIACYDFDILKNKEIELFDAWWSQYSIEWADHWNVKNLSVREMYSVLVFGQVLELDTLIENLKKNVVPKRIKL